MNNYELFEYELRKLSIIHPCRGIARMLIFFGGGAHIHIHVLPDKIPKWGNGVSKVLYFKIFPG